MSDSIRFLHSADLHLDSLFKNKRHLPEELLEQLREGTFGAFDQLVEKAIQYKVDFVLIVGDLFDEELRSLRAQVHLRNGFERLSRYDIQVFVSYGNHDYINGTHYSIEYPPNVHVFHHEDVECIPFVQDDKVRAHIYGFSYEKKHVTERKVDEFRKIEGPQYHIAMLHGSIVTNTDHDVYAPFQLNELHEKNMDYWALGHIHKREVLSEDPPVVYAGNVQGRSRNEQGDRGGYLVELEEGRSRLTFLPFHQFTFETVEYRVGALDDPGDLEVILNQAKSKAARDKSVMLTVEMLSDSGVLHKWKASGLLDEWISIVNADERENDNWVWIDQVRITERPQWDEEELKKGHHFTGALLKEADKIDAETLEDWLAPLRHHRKLSRHLENWTEKEQAEILREAKRITIDKLLANEESL
ncbi:DNA repair exonuclease [Halobacillus litoralis]|uniref:metallophosphoesterase family protein n=1 Tax=Halobacillus litoralis TaxID=45668 RepID=UPI001CD7DBBC|nr:DNA repair exonuclease [Halobacillus litoralis]MCA0969680.1 DNA repair exonuclease [Halobacillus litoralis]